jgi:aspartyl-tRNA(Asn)/glutamyl-tRNA(Gln) amidotransferase subunit B
VYQSFIGLEIHIQLLTESKVFCGCTNRFGDEPNTNVCPVCMGYPGVLPALNAQAIRLSYVVARALNCEMSPQAVFERKNYFYPDMPKNYQISQFSSPLGRNGWIDVAYNGKTRRVRIHEIHLEEDAGKMIHAGDMSLLDYNRAGTPLLEIVTEPDMEFGEEAEILLQDFRRTIRYLGVCDGNMEEGSMRCDANVSVNLEGRGLGRKVEIKNLNSSRFVKMALNYEIGRQKEILDKGGKVVQETRLWNENRDVTETMRTKESAHDYRYFPEPDLPAFVPDAEFLAQVDRGLVELPAARRERFVKDYGVNEAAADFLINEKGTADFYEEVAALGADPGAAASWLQFDVRKILNRENRELAGSPLTAARLAQLLSLLSGGRIHGKIAKQVLEAVFAEDKDPGLIIREKGWEQMDDAAELAALVDRALAANAKAAAAVKAGDAKPLGFLVGQIMKATQGRAQPQMVQELLKEKLGI